MIRYLLCLGLAIGFLVWGLAIGSSWQGIMIILAGWLSGRLWPRSVRNTTHSSDTDHTLHFGLRINS
ncbi:hypothetical protein SAMN06295937_100781 [Sphingopyxis flava]|uniref:Uncharacterized protein n=1 Tax=Sphingopyxis flava TaxID=1507287 RepID=A0A1T5BRV2_9SPHN|nr:hypothetical protein SAMN06295937_100781 [Sphingopyxis flava]